MVQVTMNGHELLVMVRFDVEPFKVAAVGARVRAKPRQDYLAVECVFQARAESVLSLQ